MKNPSDQNQLLDDILGEGNSTDFGNKLLEDMLLHVRHRKRASRRNRCLFAAAILLAFAPMLRKLNSPSSRPSTSGLPALQVVVSSPVAPSMIVESRLHSVDLITSTNVHLAVVHSQSGPGSVQEINDQELLALLAG